MHRIFLRLDLSSSFQMHGEVHVAHGYTFAGKKVVNSLAFS